MKTRAMFARTNRVPDFTNLTVNLAIVFDPARRVTFAGVVVCPMNHAAFGCPFILAAERHRVAFAKADNSRCQIDVVRDEQRLSRGERHDETLMPPSVVVVREHPSNDALPFHLNVARALLKGARECLVAARQRPAGYRGRQAADGSSSAHEAKDERQQAHNCIGSKPLESPNACEAAASAFINPP